MTSLEPTPWVVLPVRSVGRVSGLVFGSMYEDPEIELDVFPRQGRVFCIASAGDTALTLAAHGFDVTAVDINPAQLSYVRERMAGGGRREGRVDRLMSRLRRLLPLLGCRRNTIERFLSLDDPCAQTEFWCAHLLSRRLQIAARILLSRTILGCAYRRAFLRNLPARLDQLILNRLERGFGTHPNLINPFAWRLLLGLDVRPGNEGARQSSGGGHIEFVHAEALGYLSQCKPGSFHAFSLSNITDGATLEYSEQLRRAICRTAATGAVLVLRSFREPASEIEDVWAARDRSLLWGSIRVETLGSTISPSIAASTCRCNDQRPSEPMLGQPKRIIHQKGAISCCIG